MYVGRSEAKVNLVLSQSATLVFVSVLPSFYIDNERERDTAH